MGIVGIWRFREWNVATSDFNAPPWSISGLRKNLMTTGARTDGAR